MFGGGGCIDLHFLDRRTRKYNKTKMDLKQIWCEYLEWIEMAHDMLQRVALVNTERTLGFRKWRLYGYLLLNWDTSPFR